jgi:hypothetical protein
MEICNQSDWRLARAKMKTGGVAKICTSIESLRHLHFVDLCFLAATAG